MESKPTRRAADRGGAPVNRPSLPAVVVSNAAELRRVRQRRDLVRHLPYMGIALIVHVLLLVWYWGELAVAVAPVTVNRVIRAQVVDPSELTKVEPPQPAEEQLDQPEAPLDDLQAELQSEPGRGPDLDVLGLGGKGAANGPGRWGGVVVERDEDAPGWAGQGQGDGFGAFVRDLRQRGLDVVFVVDATASMQDFIDRARAAIDEIIGSLGTVVPDLRLGIVAYRDQGARWLSRKLDLTADRYRIHNFLLVLEADEGGDTEEAVDEGLRVAVEDLAWREQARHVVILVGDAPPHEADQSRTLALVRSFARDRHSLVNVLFTGVDPATQPTQDERLARTALTAIARAGRGVISELLSGEEDLLRGILEATFGPGWYEDVRSLLLREGVDRRGLIVGHKIADGDRRWLLDKVMREPVHPAVVEGCLRLFDNQVAAAVLKVLLDEANPVAVRSASLYILKRRLGELLASRRGSKRRLAGVNIDVTMPLAGQQVAVRALQDALRDALGPGWRPPERPAPPPAAPPR